MSSTEDASKLLLLSLGGTIDKDYPRLTKGYAFEFGEPAYARILKDVNPDFLYDIASPFMKDSTHITKNDRGIILKKILGTTYKYIVITHGTDTMIETATFLGLDEKLSTQNKTVVLTGAMRPERFSNSDARFNVGCALGAVQCVAPGVYIAMNGTVRKWNVVARCERTGKFVTKT